MRTTSVEEQLRCYLLKHCEEYNNGIYLFPQVDWGRSRFMGSAVLSAEGMTLCANVAATEWPLAGAPLRTFFRKVAAHEERHNRLFSWRSEGFILAELLPFDVCEENPPAVFCSAYTRLSGLACELWVLALQALLLTHKPNQRKRNKEAAVGRPSTLQQLLMIYALPRPLHRSEMH